MSKYLAPPAIPYPKSSIIRCRRCDGYGAIHKPKTNLWIECPDCRYYGPKKAYCRQHAKRLEE